MKKSTLEAIRNYLSGDTTIDVDALRSEVNAEYTRLTAKATANAENYALAKDIVLAVLSDTPLTVAEIFAKVADDLPDTFTPNKIQYALLHYWNDMVVKHDNGKNPKTYTAR